MAFRRIDPPHSVHFMDSDLPWAMAPAPDSADYKGIPLTVVLIDYQSFPSHPLPVPCIRSISHFISTFPAHGTYPLPPHHLVTDSPRFTVFTTDKDDLIPQIRVRGQGIDTQRRHPLPSYSRRHRMHRMHRMYSLSIRLLPLVRTPLRSLTAQDASWE
jgi:hypothetical protein